MANYWKNWYKLMETKYLVWQAILWDRFAKLSPILLAFFATVFYIMGYRDWNLFLDTMLAFLIVTMVTWWFWVIYTIIVISYILDHSNISISDILKEIKKISDEVKDLNPRRFDNYR